ncbi:MAG: hypothetical protein ACRD3P_09080 [Terriglobales bacterium]
MTITVKAGRSIRNFGGWYRHDYVSVDGVELMGFIQVRRRCGRIESATIFQHTSSAVIGTDVNWLYRQNKHYEQELLAKQLLSAPLPAADEGR